MQEVRTYAEAKQQNASKDEKKFRLLGDLPSLNKNSTDKEKVLSDKDVNIALSLEYNNRSKSKDFLKAESKRESDSNMHDPNIPKVELS